MIQTSAKKVVVLGASGYIGTRLIPFLLAKGYRVRAVGRTLESLQRRPWINNVDVELSVADMLDLESLKKVCQGCRAAYYLVHSMNPQQKNFEEADRQAARNMVAAAESAGIEHIVYLGGLGESQDKLSRHLRSRTEVSEILHSGKVPTTTLRAAMIMGTGSVSFEIMRYLVDRFPIMIVPRWVKTESQPIAIRNVLNYLVGCLEHEETKGKIYDIGGPEVMTYRALMKMYAKEAGLKKRIIAALPILTPHLSSYWVSLVTPVPSVLARPLTEGLRNKVVCQDERIRKIIPQELIHCDQAIRLALNLEKIEPVVIQGSCDVFLHPESKYPGDPAWAGGGRKIK